MHVYLETKARTHTLSVCPAADKPFVSGEVPSDWVTDENKPVTFTIQFVNGRAEVEDALGHYLVKRGLARKTKFMLPQAAE